MRIIYSKSAAKTIKTMDHRTKQRIKDGIEGVVRIPPEGDIKQIQDLKTTVYRLRVGKYRVIYEYTGDKNEIPFIKDIGSKGNICK